LVHDYLRLLQDSKPPAEPRTLFGIARSMRRSRLSGRARHFSQTWWRPGARHLRSRPDRGGPGRVVVELVSQPSPQREAIARVVEVRFFGGLSIDETAEAMGMSPATVKRRWTLAKAWLARDLGREEARES
jgi:DNA-directed RNA polymerase specialized sigma24 family protein